MEFINIGPGELIFILVLMIILLGPVEMVRLARRAGLLIRDIKQSALWNEIRKIEREARDLPVQLVREAGFEEQMEEIRQSMRIPDEPIKPSEEQPGDARSPGTVPPRKTGKLRPPQQHRFPSGRSPQDDQKPSNENRAEAIIDSGKSIDTNLPTDESGKESKIEESN
jgi:Sec-independent protein translocase protein TatA